MHPYDVTYQIVNGTSGELVAERSVTVWTDSKASAEDLARERAHEDRTFNPRVNPTVRIVSVTDSQVEAPAIYPALDAYRLDGGTNTSGAISDLLIDLLVIAEQAGIDLDERLAAARETLAEERALEG